jgi:hypothetical protein
MSTVIDQFIASLPEEQRAGAYAAFKADFEARIASELQQRTQISTSSSSSSSSSPPIVNTIVSAPHVHYPKPASPEMFTGVRTKVEQFISQLNRYLELSNITNGTVTPDRQVQYAAQFISGEAMVWFNNVQSSSEPISSIIELQERLRAHFQPYGVEKIARTKLRSLTQTNSVSAYNTIFMQTVQHLRTMDVADQVFAYVTGLKSFISREMISKDPQTLQEAMDYAALVESRLQNFRGGAFVPRPSASSSSSTNRYSSSNASSSSSSSSTSAPMELGNIEEQSAVEDHSSSSGSTSELNAITGSLKKLTNEERDRLRKEGRCFRCRQKGHMSNTCPKATPKNESSQQ